MGKIVRYTVKPNQKPTKAQIEEIEEAYKHPIVFDEDCPEYTYEELAKMAKLAKEKRAEQKKEVVTLRLQHSTVEKAKAVGAGYTSFLSRLIENAIKDKDLVARSL